MTALKGARINSFLSTPERAARLVLVYGPDAGLVAERAGLLLRAYAADPEDPFSVSRLDEGDISADPARLADEARAMVPGPGRRVVTISNGGAATGSALEHLIDDTAGDPVVLVSAGDLRPSSKLRKLAENSARSFALPCYLDEAGALDRMIDEELARCELSIAADARAHLRGLLGADRGQSRQEVGKLCLYALGAGTITVDDVEQACGDVADMTLEQVCDGALEGRTTDLERSFARAIAQGVHPVRLLGALSRQISLLLTLAAGLAAGRSLSDSIRSLRPPLHFKRRDHIMAQLPLWPMARLERLGRDVYDREAACRNPAIPAEAQARQTFLSIALSARNAAGRNARPGA